MSKLYALAPSGVAERVAHLMKCFHMPLHNAGLKVDLISVSDDDPDVEHALKLHGYPCYACVRAVDIKGRTMGRGDAEIVIDESKWLTLSDATRDSILDHELQHIELCLNPKNNRVRLDCRGRPKIKMRLHDLDVGWFEEIAKRHGAASIECHQANQVFLNHTQTFFAFVGEAQKSLPSSDRTSGFERMAKEQGVTIGIRAGAREVTIDKDGIRSGKTP